MIDALDAELRRTYPESDFQVDLGDADVADGAGTFLIAYDGGSAVGCGAVRRLHGSVGEIMRMYVEPEARGRGLGTVILDALEQEAAELGITEVVLETGDRSTESILLFEHHGYTRTEARDPLLGTHSVFMRKLLTAADS